MERMQPETLMLGHPDDLLGRVVVEGNAQVMGEADRSMVDARSA